MTDSGCRNCGGTGWTLHPSWSGKGDERYEPCECDRRTPPTPATEEREAVARAIKGMLFRIWGSLYDDAATRLADAALSALAPIRAQEIAAARAEEQGYRHTQVAALKQVHAAEILAAEARGAERERASKGTVTTYKRGFGPGDGDSAIEHGSGK